MFTGFTQEAQDFLWGIRFNNEKPWFEAHREAYLTHVYRPMQALTDEVASRMERAPGLSLLPRCTRIYRDARRLHGRGPYKESLWFTLRREEQDWTETPVFYFEILSDGAEWGMGCYHTAPRAMARFRKRAKANPSELAGLMEDFARQDVFTVYGEDYKKPKDIVPPPVDAWFNKRDLGFTHREPWSDVLLSPALPGLLTRDLSLLVPLYRYFYSFSFDS